MTRNKCRVKMSSHLSHFNNSVGVSNFSAYEAKQMYEIHGVTELFEANPTDFILRLIAKTMCQLQVVDNISVIDRENIMLAYCHPNKVCEIKCIILEPITLVIEDS